MLLIYVYINNCNYTKKSETETINAVGQSSGVAVTNHERSQKVKLAYTFNKCFLLHYLNQSLTSLINNSTTCKFFIILFLLLIYVPKANLRGQADTNNENNYSSLSTLSK